MAALSRDTIKFLSNNSDFVCANKKIRKLVNTRENYNKENSFARRNLGYTTFSVKRETSGVKVSRPESTER